MNEQLHTDCSILQNKLLAVLPININLPIKLPIILSTKVRGPDFFKQIVQRYSIITRSGRFPSLILHRLFAKDTKNVVIPCSMRYLKLIGDQDPDYEFQPVSTKTLATTKLVRTLPERTIHQRERSENTVILSSNHYPENDIRIIRHTLQPVMARTSQEKTQFQNSVKSKNASLSKKYLDKDDKFVSADIDKTQAIEIQANVMQIEKTGNFSELQHLKMPDFPLFDEYTNQVVADISGVGVSENTKARDIIGHLFTHTEEKIPKIYAMMAHIQKRNKLVYEKHEGFSKRTADRYLVTEKTNIANKLISNTHITRSRMANMEAEAGEVTEIPKEIPHKIPKLLFDQDGIFLQHAGNVQTGMSGPSNFSSNNIIRRPSDLVLRNLAVHSAEKGFENTGNPDIIKTERTKINAEKEDIIGTNVQVRDSIEDIDIIADRVYKRLETRISIEKERRGLR